MDRKYGAGLDAEQRLARLEQRPPATVRLTRTTPQATATGTWTAAVFTAETWDEGALANLGANADRFTCAVAGKYAVKGLIELAANATGGRLASLVKYNSAGVLQERLVFASAPAATSANFGPSGAVDMSLAVGDYVRLEVFQNSGVALDLTAGNGTYAAVLSANRIL